MQEFSGRPGNTKPTVYCKRLTFYVNKAATISEKPSRVLEKFSIDVIESLIMSRGRTHFILAVLDTFLKIIKLYASIRKILKIIEIDYIPTVAT